MKAMCKTVHIRGKVFSGIGEGAKFIELPWVKSQIKEKLGFTPYPGTLNIKLDDESVKIRKMLEKAKAIEILPIAGYCAGKCFRAFIKETVKCAIVLPQVRNYPEDIIEIIAPLNLRKKISIKDGDCIEIKIMLE